MALTKEIKIDKIEVLGNLSISGKSNIYPSGVEGIGQTGKILVWSRIDDNQTPSYTGVIDTQTSSFSNIDESQTPNYTTVTETQTSSLTEIDETQSANWQEVA